MPSSSPAIPNDSGWYIGQKVRILDGPFQGFVARVDKIDTSNERLIILIDFYGRGTPIEVDFSQVAPER